MTRVTRYQRTHRPTRVGQVRCAGRDRDERGFCSLHDTGTNMPPPDPDAVMVWDVLMASPNRDKDGMLLAAAEAYVALKSSRERAAGSSTENGEPR